MDPRPIPFAPPGIFEGTFCVATLTTLERALLEMLCQDVGQGVRGVPAQLLLVPTALGLGPD